MDSAPELLLPRRDRLPSSRADSPRESISAQFAALAIAASAMFAGSPSAAVAAATIDPTNSQLAFPLQRKTASTISPADSRRAITAACVMAAAALRRFRTAAQTAPRNSDLVALFSVFLVGNWSAIISDAVISRASVAGNCTQNPVARRRTPQNMSTVRPIIGEADPRQAGARMVSSAIEPVPPNRS